MEATRPAQAELEPLEAFQEEAEVAVEAVRLQAEMAQLVGVAKSE